MARAGSQFADCIIGLSEHQLLRTDARTNCHLSAFVVALEMKHHSISKNILMAGKSAMCSEFVYVSVHWEAEVGNLKMTRNDQNDQILCMFP